MFSRFRALLVSLLAVSLVLTGCSGAEEEPPPSAAVTTTPSPTQTRTPTPTPTPTETPSPTPTETPGPPADDLPDGVLTALVLGSDSREEGSFGGLTDVIVVAQLSADRTTLGLVSIARDTYVPIPGHGSGKINSSFALGGTDLIKQTVSELFGGLEIDYVAQSNFGGFTALTEQLGGFDVENKHANTRGRHRFEQGRIRLDGANSLTYVRERKQLPFGDLDRTERHRAALVGMMARLGEIAEEDPAQLVALLPTLYRTVKLDGELTPELLPSLIETGLALRDEGSVISLMVPISHFDMVGGQSVNRMNESRTGELGAALRDGDLTGYVEKYGEGYAPTG